MACRIGRTEASVLRLDQGHPLTNVLYVGRPAFGNEDSTVTLFKLSPDGKTATRVPVKMGRASVNAIQVLSGLNEGDTVILSDMSRWDQVDRIRLE